MSGGITGGPVSAAYAGSVVHTRLSPVRHRLRYRMLAMLLDIDELPLIAKRLRLFSAERFNAFSFHARDHLDGTDTKLRAQIEAHLARAGIDAGGGPIRVLCMPRVLGSVFNPLSVWFCHAPDGALRAVLYEVNNTFGQRHSYLMPVEDPAAPVIRQACEKRFYVSPFMEMAMQYRFRLAVPAERALIAIEVRGANGTVLSAAFAGERRELSDALLLRGLARHPMMAAQVLGAIHWEALKLWRKGMRVLPRPAPPAQAVSIGVAEKPV
ncbi:MAG: DUF1365 family protein [Proteobacteria bacterium]|nr:DUF1365 family protein [Pseudomonadota bacterium]